MKDAHYNEIAAGDRVIITRMDRPLRAVVERATEDSISIIAFIGEKVINKDDYYPYKWKVFEDMRLATLKWTYRIDIGIWDKGICTRVLKLHWDFLPEEVKFYGTDDPKTLIKTKLKRKTVKKIKSFSVGQSKWMGENLDVQHFRNGEVIPLVTDEGEWEKAGAEGTAACCYYSNNQGEFGTRGLLYNAHAVNDPRGLAPEGWHIATEAEYREMIDLYGGEHSAGKLLRHQKGWYDGPFMSMSDFKGLPNGVRHQWGEFEGEGHYGQWIVDCGNGNFSMMLLRGDDIDALVFPVSDPGIGFSVRCVKDGK